VVNSKTVNRPLHLIVSAALALAGLGGVARARALPPDGKQVADAQASQSQAPAASPVAVPPKITYEGGQLTIIAENSMLSDVMNALHTVLGADIDLPASAAGERVWARLGPGPARKVLSDLLSGTDLNFVIQGSATDVAGIRSVLLTPHTESTPAGPGGLAEPSERMANRRFAGARPIPAEPPQQESPAPAETPAAPPAADATPAATPPTTPSVPVAATATQPAAGDAASFSTSDVVAHPAPPESMTQQNISQQLLSMYQQRRQLNQQGVQPPPAQTPPASSSSPN